MFSNKFILKVIATFAVVTLIASCSESNIAKAEIDKAQPISLDVYKSFSCSCCKKWISHIEGSGFQSNVYNKKDISVIKEKKGIEPRYRSCHTAISNDGYVFEGHIPAKYIQKFLKEKHADNVIGLSVPAMPVGSPGMEVDDKFQPYRVLLLKSDGSYETYAHVESYKEQF